MADYKAVKGLTIQTVSSDPSNITVGDVWYNTTLGKLKGAGPGSWASGGNMSAGDLKHRMCFGTYQASQATGGNDVSGNAHGKSEQYDGTSWTEVADLNTNRSYGGNAGVTTAGICFGGLDHPGAAVNVSEEWDGSSWAEGDNLNAAKYYAGSCGTQTAAMMVGGTPGATAQFETYNGTSWTEEDHGLTNARTQCGGWGITTAALICGGTPGPVVAYTETYDGSSWSETGDLNTARAGEGGTSLNEGGVGTNGIRFGGSGSTPHYANTEQFNGSTWTEVGDLAVALMGNGGSGTGDNALSIGGNSPPNTYRDDTYEWTNVVSGDWEVT